MESALPHQSVLASGVAQLMLKWKYYQFYTPSPFKKKETKEGIKGERKRKREKKREIILPLHV